ncbi:uncharacterized protein METZ01_LOCUS511389 [marine metagenome]|uniref:Uncharacterized protein n=1 Tax=marine metagenome TaxID=408172 RepID=A0A383EQL5_9ZZZZ
MRKKQKTRVTSTGVPEICDFEGGFQGGNFFSWFPFWKCKMAYTKLTILHGLKKVRKTQLSCVGIILPFMIGGMPSEA